MTSKDWLEMAAVEIYKLADGIEKARTTASSMLVANIDRNDVALITKLPINEVDRLIEELKENAEEIFISTANKLWLEGFVEGYKETYLESQG